MPIYRSINVALHSQFDLEALPEYYPLPQEHYTSRGVTQTVPKLIDDASSTCSVYVPILPGSTFWIGYLISPPVPQGHYFLFKLHINGAHIVSWSCGGEEGWRGKTMFGLYERAEDEDGKRKVEKRVLRFTSPNEKDNTWDDVRDLFDEKMCLEIKVHRAHGRKRVEREMEVYDETRHAKNTKGIDLVNAGRASAELPKRFYKFALTDPVDQPFATFRYFYRTWDQLEYLGVLGDETRGVGEGDDLPVIEPYEDSVRNEETRNVSRASDKDTDDIWYECSDGAAEATRTTARLSSPNKSTSTRSDSPLKKVQLAVSRGPHRSTGVSEQPRAYVPRGANVAAKKPSCGQMEQETGQHHSGIRTPAQSYRLSVPPSIKLVAPQQDSRPLPSVPHKSDFSSSTSYRPHPAYPVEAWRVQTPSPVRSTRDGISTPPLERNKGQGSRATSFMSAISSSWKHHAPWSSGSHGGVGGQDKGRSISR